VPANIFDKRGLHLMWTQFMVRLTNLVAGLDREEGQGMVEYSLILFLVSIAAIVVLGEIGVRLGPFFEKVRDALPAT